MSGKVTVYVSVTDAETGQTVNLAPGDTAPDWAKLGKHCFAKADDLEEEVAGPGQGLPGNVPDEERRRRAKEASERAKARQKEADDEAERAAAEKQPAGKPSS